MLRICAWVFSNCGCHDEAADAYLRLLLLLPDWAEGHRHASGALAACGRLDEAVAHAVAAAEAAPQSLEFALHAAAVLRAAQHDEEAGRYLDRALALEPANAGTLCQRAAVHLAQGRGDLATALALEAAEQAGDAGALTDAAEILLQCGLAAKAAALLSEAGAKAGAEAGAECDDGRLWRVLSAAEMLRDRLEASLMAADRAIAAAPECAEYRIHRALLLARLGDLPGAAASLDAAARLDPAGRDLKRAELDLLLAGGLVSEATMVGGELLQRFPDDKPAAEAVWHVLSRRLDAIEGEYSVLSDGAERAVRPLRHPPALLERLRTQRRVIAALIIRDTRTRFADAKLGYGWALIEPVLHITLLSAMFAVLMHGQPPVGRHFFIFYYTGLIPYHVFVHASAGMSHAVTGNGAVLQLPPVTTFDVIAARGLLEVATDIVVAVILLAGFGAIGLAAMPDDLWAPSTALLATAAFGCGVGYVNAVVTVFFRSWDKAYSQLMRVLYFISGIFYVPAMMPDWARDALAWNPILQAVDWFRAGFFASYQPHWLDRSYLVGLAVLALCVGFAAERGLRRRLGVAL
ncbi:MAG: ABC transporter permease [Thiohalocapsa sp.]